MRPSSSYCGEQTGLSSPEAGPCEVKVSVLGECHTTSELTTSLFLDGLGSPTVNAFWG